MNLYKVLLLILSFYLLSCNKEKELSQEEQVWHMGWRMIMNSLEEKVDVAEVQFDSLLDITSDLDIEFLLVGLQSKSKVGQRKFVSQMMSNLQPDVFQGLCSRDLLSELELCQNLPTEKVENPIIQNQIIKLYVDDQAVRGNILNELIQKYNLDSTQIATYSPLDVDETNRIELQKIIAEYGFPTKNMIGKDAMGGVFYIIQHSDGDKDWQKKQLKDIEIAVHNGDMEGRNYAYLYDRIRVNSGENQLYGTQFANVDIDNKIITLAPVDDIKNLDNRRRKMKMMPIELYKHYALQNMEQ